MGKTHKNEKKSKKKHKHKDRKEKQKPKKRKQSKHKLEEAINPRTNGKPTQLEENAMDFSIPLDLMNSKSHAPETPEEYQKRQSRIRREVDPVTGRIRLVKGESEVLEEIVSRDRHKAINRDATKGDGQYFEHNTLGKLR